MSSLFVVAAISTKSIPTNFLSELRVILENSHFKITSIDNKNTSFWNALYLQVEADQFNKELVNLELMKLSALHQIDVGLIPHDLFFSPKKLAIFDMDATLITAEVIDEMAMKHGVGEAVKLITIRAMNGELDFNQSLTERVGLLKGFHRRHMQEILNGLQFTPGAENLIRVLKSMGVKTAIASGGFRYFAEHVKTRLGIDLVLANELDFEGDHLTGKVTGAIVNAEAKAEFIVKLAQEENCRLDQVIAIGDGANDIPMLLRAGLGIAIHAKEKVQKSANFRINFGPMTHALGYLNYEAV